MEKAPEDHSQYIDETRGLDPVLEVHRFGP